MKILILVIPVLFLVSFSKNNTQNVNIFDAIKNKQIEIIAVSNGGYSGKSIVLEIKKLTNISSVIIPSGTRFNSEFEYDQDLITIDDEILVLNSNSTLQTINGFCVQQSNKSPTDLSLFTIAKENDDKIVKVAKHMNNKGFNDHIKQTAIWSASNNRNVSGIYEDGNEKVEELRAYVCTVLGKENVWYNTDPSYSVDENRNIIQETTRIEGLLSYTVTKTGNMKMEICKENGEVYRTLGGETPVSMLGDYSFNFKLMVKGWKSGKYIVQLKIGDEIIHKEDFVIS